MTRTGSGPTSQRASAIARGTYPGRKIDPPSLTAPQQAALARAAAAAEYRLQLGESEMIGDSEYLPTMLQLIRPAGRTAPKMIEESAGHGLIMGHKKITTTYDIYGHLLPGAQDEVRRRMDAYLAGDDALTGARTGARPDLAEPEIVADREQTA